MSAQPDLSPWVHNFTAEESRAERVDAWVQRTGAAILREMPELAKYDELTIQLHNAIREHWTAFLHEFDRREPMFRFVASGRTIALEIARQLELPLETLIQIYRVAQTETWSYVTGVVHDLPAGSIDHAAVLIHFWTAASTWIDRSITESIREFHVERSRVLAGTEVRRYDTVRDLLSGEFDDPRLVSAELGGYPLSAHHTALVLRSVESDALGDLRSFATDLARVTSVRDPLTVKTGGRSLWMWLATHSAVDPAPLREISAAASRLGIWVGVGSSAPGLEGFALSHQEAQEALRIGQRAEMGPSVICFTDVELASLLPCSPAVERFVKRTLRELAGEDESVRRVRETVGAYLAAGGDVNETANCIFVHRNTVRYRLAQATELLGTSIPKTSGALALAIKHLEIYHRRPPTSGSEDKLKD